MKVFLSLALTLCVTSPTYGEAVKVYAAAAVKSPFVKLAEDYEKQYAFSKTGWADSVAANWFRQFYQPTYLDATRIGTTARALC